MKKRILQGMMVACMLLIGFMAMAQTSSNPVGKWDFSIPEAPYEYSKGKSEFKMQNSKLVFVMLANGQELGQPVEVVKKDGGYVINIETEYFSMTIALKPEGDNLKGTISSDQWNMGITFTPEKN